MHRRLNQLLIKTSFITLISFSQFVYAEVFRDYYSEPGLNPFGSVVNDNANELIDPFGGTLQLSYTDIVVPGNGGMDIKVNRVYTSLQGSLGPRTVNGAGWLMHFGRLLVANNNKDKICSQNLWSVAVTDNPFFEHPDGRREMLVLSIDGNYLVSKSRWKFVCSGNDKIITSPDGIRYELGFYDTDSINAYYYVTKITDLNGNFINIDYLTNRVGLGYIDKVTASDGRLVQYNYTDETEEGEASKFRLTAITSNNQTWNYGYTLIPGVGGNYYQLTEVTRPDSLKWRYEYNPNFTGLNDVGHYSLKKVTYPYGGVIDYTYQGVQFNSIPFEFDPMTHAIATKTVSGANVTSGVWTFDYEPHSELGWDITTITTPNAVEKYYHKGYDNAGSGQIWAIGLLHYKEIYDLTETTRFQFEEYQWEGQVISDENYWHGREVTKIDYETAVPLLKQKKIWRESETVTTDYLDYDIHGNAGKVIESTNAGTRDELDNFTYYPPRETIYTYDIDETKWILNRVKDETITGIGTISRTYDTTNGNLLSQDKYGVVTAYTYTAEGEVETITDARLKVTTYSNYYRGEAQLIQKPENVIIEQEINPTGTLAWEKDGELNITSYTYDDMNRLSRIDYPINADVTITRTENLITLERGNYKETTTLGGFGRKIGINRIDTTTNESIVTQSTYDALGEKIFTSYPSSTEGINTTYDGLGRVTKTEHSDGAFSTVEYGLSDTELVNVTVTDENGNITKKFYQWFGNPDNKWLSATYYPEDILLSTTRNLLGQVTSIWQGSTIENTGLSRTYTYNENYYLKTENHPETGVTAYNRDELGNIIYKRVGGSYATIYDYDDLNRIKFIDYPYGTPDVTYTYYRNDKPKSVTNSNSSRSYTYDANNNLKKETIIIDGKTSLIQYVYDTLDNLATLTYPSGRIITYAPNAFGRPTKATPFVTDVTYYPSGATKKTTYANGQSTQHTLSHRLWLESIKTNGVTNVIDQTYSYDNMGNVKTITNTLNPEYNLSLNYDGVNRLKAANGIWGNGSITYDQLGNIKTKKMGQLNRSYLYVNNKLLLIGGDTLGDTPLEYDVYGNVERKGHPHHNIFYTHNYDNASNLINSKKYRSVYSTTSDPIRNVTYKYDGSKNRISRVDETNVKNYYIYDNSSKLLYEFNPDDTRLRTEFIYLNDQQIAKIENSLPNSVAGEDQTVYPGVNVILDGSLSTAFRNNIVSYLWEQASLDPVVTINDSSSAIANFTAPSVNEDAELTFKLTVTDDTGMSHSDLVTITVWPASSPSVSMKVMGAQGDGYNTIKWTPTERADSYNIYWSTSPGVTPQTGTLIYNVSPPYTHLGLTNGVDYYYIVTAVNAYGETPLEEVKVSTGKNGWTAPFDMSDQNEIYQGVVPSAVAPSSGKAISINTSQAIISVKFFDINNGWTLPEIISDRPLEYIDNIDASINDNGDAVIILEGGNGERDVLNNYLVREYIALRYDATNQIWSPAEHLSSTTHQRDLLSVDIDDSGNIFVVRNDHYTNGGVEVVVWRFDSSSSEWSYKPIESRYQNRADQVLSAMNTSGQYIIRVTRSTDSIDTHFGYRYEPDSGWILIEAPYTNVSEKFLGALHMTEKGDALEVYFDANNAYAYYAAWHHINTGWETSEKISDNPKRTIRNINIETDYLGNTLLVWSDYSAPYIYNIHEYYTHTVKAKYYIPSVGWGGVYDIDRFDSNLNLPSVKIDRDEDKLVVTWSYRRNLDGELEYRNSRHIWLGDSYENQNLPPIASATTTQQVDEATTITLTGSGYDQDGNDINYQWVQIAGIEVFINNADAAIATVDLPSFAKYEELLFELRVQDNDGAVGTDVVKVSVSNTSPPYNMQVNAGSEKNILSWDNPPAGATPIGYNIYWGTSPGVSPDNGALISNVSSPYVHPGLQNGTKYYYVLTSLDNNDGESEPSGEVFGRPNGLIWPPAEDISSGVSQDLQQSILIMDSTGAARVLFTQSDVGINDPITALMSNTFMKNDGWGAVERVNALPSGIDDSMVDNFDYAFDDFGNGFAVWDQFENQNIPRKLSVWARKYNIQTGWEDAFLLENETNYSAGHSRIASDGKGNYAVVWYQEDNLGNTDIIVRRYLSDTGWQAPENIDIESGHWSVEPQVAINTSGDIIVTWTSWSSEDNTSTIFASWYTASIGQWSTPVTVNKAKNSPDEDSALPNVVIDNFGNATVIWVQIDVANQYFYNAYARRINTHTNIVSELTLLNDSMKEVVLPDWGSKILPIDMAIDGIGNVITTWSVYSGLSYEDPGNIYAKEYRNGLGWTDTVLVNDISEQFGGIYPKVARNSQGDTLIVWNQRDGLRANYRKSGANWNGVQVITDNSVYKSEASIGIDSLGSVIVAWPIAVQGGYDLVAKYLDISLAEFSNASPTANAGSDNNVISGSVANLNGSLSLDPDGTITNYQWLQLGGPTVNIVNATSENASFTTPIVTQATPLTFQLIVTDNDGDTNADLVVINVVTELPINQPPVITQPENQMHEEWSTVSLLISGSDVENDQLTYSATNLPAGLVIDSVTGLIGGTIAAGAATNSPYNVIVFVSDGVNTVSKNFTWVVTLVNQVPQLQYIPDQSHQEGDSVSLLLSAPDPENDPVTFSSINLPAGLTLDPVAGLISGAIAVGAAANSPYSVTITATDGSPSSSVRNFSWFVSEAAVSNTAPQVTNPGSQSHDEGEVVVGLQITASDADGDALTFSANNLPVGLSIDASTGVISGTLAMGSNANSPYTVTVSVSDGQATSTSSFNWTVTTPVSLPIPTIDLSPAVVLASAYTFTGSVASSYSGSEIRAYQNDTVIATSVVDSNGDFSVPVTLSAGLNRYQFSLYASDTESARSDERVVYLEADGQIRYYLLNPYAVDADLVLVSLSDNTQITVGSLTPSLNQDQRYTVPASELSQGSVITASAPLSLGSSADAVDMPVPASMASQTHVLPHFRGKHTYYLLSPYGDTTTTITVGASTQTVNLTQGVVQSYATGDEEIYAGRVESDLPILMTHLSEYATYAIPIDAYAVAPPATELWGVRNTNAVVGALMDGTTVSAYASDGTTATYTLNAGEKAVIAIGDSTREGQGSGLYLVANHPITAASGGDGDGDDMTAFWGADRLSTRLVLPTDGQYLVVVCPSAGTNVTFTNGTNAPSTLACGGDGTMPGKLYYGSEYEGPNLAAGSLISSDQPIYVMYEDTATNEEHNLLGTLAGSTPPANTAPLAINDNATTAEDSLVLIDVLLNDSDADGDNLLITAVTQAANGSVVITGDNTVSYTPALNYYGSDSFSYTISDGNGGSATGTVAMTITAVNDQPAANDDNMTTSEDIAITNDVLSNDSDVDGDTLVVSAVTQAANGSVVINPNNTLTYTPTPNYNGSDNFSYTVSDGNGGSATATVTVAITAVSNTAPQVTNPGSQSHDEGEVVVGLQISASDADGDALTYSATNLPAGLSINSSTGVISGTLAAGAAANSPYTVTVSVSDGQATSTSSFSWTVSVVSSATYNYRVLNPALASGASQVVSLVDNNTIQVGNITLTLNRYESGMIPASEMQQGALITGTGPFDIGTSVDTADIPVPNVYEGTAFVIPHNRTTHTYYLYSETGTASVNITLGTTTQNVSVPPGQVTVFDAGNDNTLAGIIHSGLPIRVMHHGRYDSGQINDVYAVPPPALEVWGVRSNQITVGALNDNTEVTITSQDGSTNTVVLNAGDHHVVVTGRGDGQGKGDAIRVSATKLIAAVQTADWDGDEQTALIRTEDLSNRFGIPTATQYIAVVCPTVGTQVKLYNSVGSLLSQQTCSGSVHGKAYFGNKASGTHIPAGSYLESDQPVMVMVEDSITEEENNLLGTVE